MMCPKLDFAPYKNNHLVHFLDNDQDGKQTDEAIDMSEYGDEFEGDTKYIVNTVDSLIGKLMRKENV